MKMTGLISAIIILFAVFAALAGSSTAAADEGLVRTTWPSQDDPGMPFYARVELLPPYIFNNGEWAAVVFYREPECVPGEFNLIDVFDFQGAFGCPHTVHGTSLWHGEVFNGAPKIIDISGNGAVPVWFVPWDAVKERAHADGVLTKNDLEAIDGRLVGYAEQYTETLHPHADPNIGGGGHPNPKMIVNAQGQLEDGRAFKLHISWVRDEVQAIRIQFE